MKTYAILVVLSMFFIGVWQLQWLSDNHIFIYVLDVGQGDSILVEIPGEKTILVDGGPGDYVLARLGEVLPPWIRQIDTVVLTHQHADHIDGLLDVIERYQVEEVIFNPVCNENPSYEYFLRELDRLNIRTQYLDEFGYIIESASGVKIAYFTEFWNECGDRVSVEGPCGNDCGECALSLNNTSIATAITYGFNMVMLMGDAEKEVESSLAKAAFRMMGYPEKVILKAGHHCSRTASDAAFLDRIRPAVAICSLGEENSFGHPHAETIQRFKERGIPYLRTDEEGTIVVELSPEGWEIE